MSTRQTPPLSCAGDIAADRPLLSCKGSVLTIVSQLWHCIGLKLAKTWSPRPIVAERAKRKCEHVPQLVRVASKAHIVQWTVVAVINWGVIVNFEMSLCYLSSKSVHINRGLGNTQIQIPPLHPPNATEKIQQAAKPQQICGHRQVPMICNVWTVFPIDCGKCSQVFIIHNWSVQRLADLIYGTSSNLGIYRT